MTPAVGAAARRRIPIHRAGSALGAAFRRRRVLRAWRAVSVPWAAALLVALALDVAPAGAQVFLAERPHPEFEIGPLFVRASVGPELGPVAVDVLWSLTVPPTRSALGLEQDLYLLWPWPIASEAGQAADPALGEYVRARGFEVTEAGVVPLAVQDLYSPTGARSERAAGQAPFVTFRRVGLSRVGLQSAASLVRIPWTPDLVNRTRLVRLRLHVDQAIRPRRANWLEEAIRGRRHLVSIGFGDVRSPAVFPLFRENRERVIPLASDPSQLLIRFADAERLRVDEVSPASGTRQPRGGSPPSEVVSLFLDTSAGAVPQTLSVTFGYTSGLQAWAPILIPLVFFVLGRATGPLIERAARSVGRTVAARIRLRSEAAGRREGALPSRDTLARILPGQTRYEEVLALCGHDALEEEEQLGLPDRRTLVYRGRQIVPKRHRRLAWFLAAVSEWEVEEQTVQITIDKGVVADVQVRVRRAHLPYPDTA